MDKLRWGFEHHIPYSMYNTNLHWSYTTEEQACLQRYGQNAIHEMVYGLEFSQRTDWWLSSYHRHLGVRLPLPLISYEKIMPWGVTTRKPGTVINDLLWFTFFGCIYHFGTEINYIILIIISAASTPRRLLLMVPYESGIWCFWLVPTRVTRVWHQESLDSPLDALILLWSLYLCREIP